MNWIKCSERMPEKEETVLVWHSRHSYVEKLDWTGSHWSPLYYDRSDITHWMPLSGPPKGDE